ncbi:hypothetical protein GCM10010415_14610 [Streptomyces atrovirens]|uniref:Peptidase inhibitor family I36 n=1 Tax=Streptomyces atrovirens TaxID=285556 RepID=A0ABW0DU75_9ACTN
MLRTVRTHRAAAAVLSGAALLAGLGAGAAPRAHAAPSVCQASALCLYSEYGLTGELRLVYPGSRAHVENVKSLINFSRCDAVLKTSWAGDRTVVQAGFVMPRITRQNYTIVLWDDCS